MSVLGVTKGFTSQGTGGPLAPAIATATGKCRDFGGCVSFSMQRPSVVTQLAQPNLL